MPRASSRGAKVASPRRLERTQPPLHLYRKVVISFAVLVGILVVVVLYFSLVKATISIVPKPQPVTADFTVTVVETEDGQAADQLNGVFFSRQVEGEKQFKATGSQALASDTVGRVRIHNQYRRPQPLVATTRLQSDSGVILRTVDRVDVPVNGFVDVDVTLDSDSQLPSSGFATGTKFTIPGLWLPLQEDIYAEALTAITVGDKQVTVVSAEDLTRAETELLAQLEEQTLQDLGVDNKIGKSVSVQLTDKQASAKVGDQTERFSMKAKATVQGVFFDRESLLRLAEKKLRTSLPADRQLLVADYENITYDISDLNITAKTATLTVHAPGTSVVRLNSGLFDKANIKGMTTEELRAYFQGQESIQSFDVTFFPFWVQRVPQLLDHIDIRIQQ